MNIFTALLWLLCRLSPRIGHTAAELTARAGAWISASHTPEQLVEALSRLPTDELQVCLLLHRDRLSYEQIGERLGISVERATELVVSARCHLWELLEGAGV